jgi:WD40 repeat protein
MTPALADRLCRALVGCYPPRWKRRYAEELLDVLDQHRAGRRTVLSLAGGALSTHLDPDYRMEIRVMPRLSRDAWMGVGIAVAVPAGVLALLVLPQIPRTIRESSWHPSNGDAVGAIAFSHDQRILVSAAGGPPWDATSTLWNVTGQAQPRRLSEFEGGNPVTISPDGATVATNAFGGQPALWNVTRPRHPAREAVLSAGFSGTLWGEAFSPDGRILAVASTSGLFLWNVADPVRPRLLRTLADPVQADNPGSFDVGNGDLIFSPDGHILASISGNDQVALWNVTRPARATRIATLTGPRDYFTALAFSPDGNLLAGATYHGSVRLFRLTSAARPIRVTTRRGILARARFPAGGGLGPCGTGCAVAAYALAFTPDGHALTVVINRAEPYPSTTDRDTVFTWQVAISGALSDLTTFYRDVSDGQPTLPPGDRVVADGSEVGGDVHLWATPGPAPRAGRPSPGPGNRPG